MAKKNAKKKTKKVDKAASFDPEGKDKYAFGFVVTDARGSAVNDIVRLKGVQNTGVNQPADYENYIRHIKGWVYACSRVIAETVAGQPLEFFKRKGKRKTDWQPLPENHPLVVLFDRPNSTDTNVEFWQDLVEDLQVMGNAYWHTVRAKGGKKQGAKKQNAPKELWVVPGQYMFVVPDAKERVRGYVYRRGSDEKRWEKFDSKDIEHFRLPRGGSMYYGMSPMAAMANTINADEYMTAAQDYTFRNMPNPGVIIRNTGKGKRLTPKETRLLEYRLRKYMKDKGAGRSMFLENGLDIEKWDKNAEMDWRKSSDVTSKRIMGGYGVPPAVLGMVDLQNRANAESAQFSFMMWTIRPLLKLIEARINAFIADNYDGDIIAQFKDPVPKDRNAEKADWEAGLKAGIATIDEGRQEWLGLDKLPKKAGTSPLVQAGVMPLLLSDGTLNPNLGAPQGAPAEPEEPEEESKGALPSRRDVRASEKEVDRIVNILVDAKGEAKILDEAMSPEIARLLEDGAAKEALTLGISPDAIDMSAQPFVDALNSRAETHWRKTVVKVNRDELKTLIATAIDEGVPVLEVADRIREKFGPKMAARADMIARTEVVGSLNQGAFALQQQAGVPLKEWVGTSDTRVRSTHSTANGQIRKTDKKFRVGGAWLLYPGDPSGPAGEVCNCRCAVAGLFSRDDARTDEVREELWRDRVADFVDNEKIVVEIVDLYFQGFIDRVLAKVPTAFGG